MSEKKEDIFKCYCLSARNITCRIEEMSENPKSSQIDYFEKPRFFSTAIDESTDTAQLAIFVREIEEDFYVLEEFVEVIPIKNTTTERIF